MSEIRELVRISQFGGQSVLFVQGGGGNGSVKSRDLTKIWVKASGFLLSEVHENHGYVEVDLLKLVALLNDASLVDLPRHQAHEEFVRRAQALVLNSHLGRPSLEVAFHAILDRVVLHTHPVYVNAFTCMEDGEALLSEVLKEPLLWIDYESPGYALGLKVAKRCETFRNSWEGRMPSTILLRNHGLIESAASVEEVVKTTLKLASAGLKYFGPFSDNACGFISASEELLRWTEQLSIMIQKHFGKSFVVRVVKHAALLRVATDPDLFSVVCKPIVPDDVIYGGYMIWVDPSVQPDFWLKTQVSLPDKMVLVLEGLGMILVGSNESLLNVMEENLLARVLVCELIKRRGRVRSLPPSEIEYLLSMESEKYRQGMMHKDVLTLGEK